MAIKTSTVVTLDLSKELTPEELESFRREAARQGRSLKEHVEIILFGDADTTRNGGER